MAHRAACVKVLTCLFLLFFLFSPKTARPAASPRTVLSVGISGPGQVRAYVREQTALLGVDPRPGRLDCGARVSLR